MLHHAFLPPSVFGIFPVKKSSESKRIDFRNMFPEDTEMTDFVGFGPGSEERTRTMLERLAVRMAKEGESGADGVNTGIPAGYTYLAQLVSHDIVQSVPAGPDPTDATQADRNLRVERLMLDTIYGRGPETSALPFAQPRRAGEDRTRLRLGKCRLDGARPAGGPALDIPRTRCPEIDNLPDRGASEVLLADPRNDVSLILSQLTVVFHLLHNRIDSDIAVQHASTGQQGDQAPEERLAKARKAAAIVFRSVVQHDLMPRLLCQSEHDRLSKALTTGQFLDTIDDHRLPVEFSHAAYRAGHSMVRATYAVNDDHPVTGLKDVVRFTSERRPFDMPLSSDWLVQWSRFFEVPGRQPNFSRPIGPSVARGLGVNDLFPTQDDEYGGLVLADLLRGAEAGHRSVNSLIDKLPAASRTHPFLADPATRTGRIAEWLQAGDSSADGDPGFDADDIDKISADPPLLFFVLMEAQEVQGGSCLGPVGSMVVGESVYAALYKSRTLLEDDPDMPDVMTALFPGGTPQSMQDVIQHLVSCGDLPEF